MIKQLITLLLFMLNASVFGCSWADILDAKKDLIARYNCQLIIEQYESFCAGNAPAIVDPRVKKIPIIECNETLVDSMAFNNPRIYMAPQPSRPFESPDCSAGFACSSQMRLSVFEKLQEMVVQLDALAFEFGYKAGDIDIVVFEGLRLASVQEELFQNKRMEIKMMNPSFSDDELDCATSKWVSPTKNNIPVHSTGAAIDIRLKARGEFIDMGKFGVIWGPNDTVPTFSEAISDTQKNNRLLLLMAATKAGLVNYLYEFWHFSFGDRYEAFWKQKNSAQYGSV